MKTKRMKRMTRTKSKTAESAYFVGRLEMGTFTLLADSCLSGKALSSQA